MSSPWESFVDETYRSLYRFGYHLTGSVTEAEDLTQEAYLRFLRRWPALPSDRTEAKKMLYRTCRNLQYDILRRARRFSRTLLGVDSPRESPDHSIEVGEVLSLLKKLSPQQREVFVLRHFHDFSTAETAEILGIGQSTVKTHLARAVAFLKEELITDETR